MISLRISARSSSSAAIKSLIRGQKPRYYALLEEIKRGADERKYPGGVRQFPYTYAVVMLIFALVIESVTLTSIFVSFSANSTIIPVQLISQSMRIHILVVTNAQVVQTSASQRKWTIRHSYWSLNPL